MLSAILVYSLVQWSQTDPVKGRCGCRFSFQPSKNTPDPTNQLCNDNLVEVCSCLVGMKACRHSGPILDQFVTTDLEITSVKKKKKFCCLKCCSLLMLSLCPGLLSTLRLLDDCSNSWTWATPTSVLALLKYKFSWHPFFLLCKWSTSFVLMTSQEVFNSRTSAEALMNSAMWPCTGR